MRHVCIVAALLCLVALAFSQDSTTVHAANQAVGALSAIPLLFKIFATLGVVSEILACVPAKYIPANGVLHGIWLLITSINWPKSSAKVFIPLLIIAGTMFTSTVKAQTVTASLTNSLPDSIKTWKGYRLTGPMAVYGYNKNSGNTLMTGVGLAYTWQHLTTGSTWWVDEAVGIAAYAGGSAAPTSVSMISAAGPYVSFFNGFVTVGGAWNFTTGKPMLTFGVALPLISN